MKRTHPPYTSLTLEYLVKRDDFCSVAEMLEGVGCKPTQLSASLHHLQKHRAADCVNTPEGLYWFATPDTDTRTYHIKQRADHTLRKPRRAPRKKDPEPCL